MVGEEAEAGTIPPALSSSDQDTCVTSGPCLLPHPQHLLQWGSPASHMGHWPGKSPEGQDGGLGLMGLEWTLRAAGWG